MSQLVTRCRQVWRRDRHGAVEEAGQEGWVAGAGVLLLALMIAHPMLYGGLAAVCAAAPPLLIVRKLYLPSCRNTGLAQPLLLYPLVSQPRGKPEHRLDAT